MELRVDLEWVTDIIINRVKIGGRFDAIRAHLYYILCRIDGIILPLSLS